MKRETTRAWYRRALGKPWLAYGVIPVIRKLGLVRSKTQSGGNMAPVVEELSSIAEVRQDLGPRVDYIPASYAECGQVGEFIWRGPTTIRRFFEAAANASLPRGKSYMGSLYGCFRQELEGTYSVVLKNGRIDAQSGFVLSETGEIFRLSNASRLKDEDRFRLAEKPSDVEKLGGAYVSLVHPWASNYAHWLLDFLPRVILAEKHGHEGAYLIPKGNPKFLHASLVCLGIAAERVVETGAKYIEVETLLVPVVAKATLMPRPEYMHAIRELSRKGVDKADAKPTRRLYISRKAAERSIANEAELIPILQSHGFEILQPENLTYEQQVSAFAEAEILMGPHGAGMYNGLFMSPPSMVIEIFNEARWELSAMRLCRLLGVEHWHIHASNKDFSNWLTHVDPGEFKRSLEAALGFMEWKRNDRAPF